MKKRGEKRTGCCGGGGRETFDRPAIPPANREPRHCFFDVFVAWISREGLKIPSSSTAVTLNSSFSRKRMRIFRFELIFANSLFELPFFTRWDDNEKTIMWIDLWIFWNLFFCSLVWMVLRLNELKWWLNVFWMVLRENENDARFLCGFLWEFFEFWSWFVWYPIVWYHIVICNIEISLFSFLEISSFLEL